MEFVNSILDSIGAIARGQIGIVADKVEGALAKALPLAISFLASLLGLGGISDKIREGIEMVRKPIQKAVDFVVMGAVKGFQKLFGGAIGWVKDKAAKGKAWVKDKATAAKDWAAGKAGALKDKITGKGDETKHKAIASKAAEEIEGPEEGPAEGGYESVRAKTEARAQAAEEKYQPEMEEGIRFRVVFDEGKQDKEDDEVDFKVVIAPNTTVVPGKKKLKSDRPAVRPDTSWGPLINDCGSWMLAYIDPKTADFSSGTEPEEGTWPNWWEAAAPNDNTYWVRGHLLNHNIGGPGIKQNMTPITKGCNSKHHRHVEKLVKEGAKKHDTLAYQVQVIYDESAGPKFTSDRDKDPDPTVWPKIAKGLQCEWEFIDGNTSVEKGAVTILNMHR
jgi:hypothetical protein